jgi:LytS/YehU family sensor histidine kinase
LSAEPRARDALVPEFILQPLVENAIRHGISKLPGIGLIEITAREDDGRLSITIRDNGPGYRPTAEAGVGLANTRARLETLYKESAKLQVANDERGGTIATVRLPLRRKVDG